MIDQERALCVCDIKAFVVAVFCVLKVFLMLTCYCFLLFISCAASVPVHNGKGIRLTPNEKIQPSRGRFH